MKLLYLVESGESKFLVFDEMPDKISTKYGDDTIIGRIGGIFYDFLAKRNERREAFGGRKFDIVLDNGEIEKCEGQWWDAATDRAREELEKEGNPLSKMVLIGVSSVDRLLDCYVYYGLWASESKIEEMIADYKGRIYEYYEFKEEVINKINETLRKSYIQSWKERIIRSGMRQKGKDVFESPDGLYIEMVYENKAFVPYRPIKEIQDLPIDAKHIPLLTRIFGKNILAEIESINSFNNTLKNANEIKDRVLKHVYNIKQERSYNNDLVGTFERYKDIADGDMEVAMNFIKEVYPFNEETESFIRKKFDMPIPDESKEQ